MGKNAEHVKQWRTKTKERIIQSMGGCCVLCGYNKIQQALALHHLNPSEKEFSFGAIRAEPKKWITIVNELRKCVLVCHNCHTEVHAGVSVIPDNVRCFDESYIEYKAVLQKTIPIYDAPKTTVQDKLCPVCGLVMPNSNRTCSRQCSGKLHRRFDWDSIDLAELLKTKSYLAIADDLGVSDAAVHKRAKKLGLKK